MTYEEWLKTVPEAITKDALWNMKAYRLALFLNDVAWHDVTKLTRDARTLKVADQLYRAVGSIGANIAEGYSRRSGKERAHFYEYALGSARRAATGTTQRGTSWWPRSWITACLCWQRSTA